MSIGLDLGVSAAAEVELASNVTRLAAWEHERRDPGGQWISGAYDAILSHPELKAMGAQDRAVVESHVKQARSASDHTVAEMHLADARRRATRRRAHGLAGAITKAHSYHRRAATEPLGIRPMMSQKSYERKIKAEQARPRPVPRVVPGLGEQPPFALRGSFDPGKHPRGFHGRWAHEAGGGKLPFSRSGGTVAYHGSMGIDRKDMPQLSGLVGGEYVPTAVMMPRFLDYLRSKGINAQKTTIPAAKLRPTQTTGDTDAIRHIADALKDGTYPGKRITVSQDHRVMDGHHNWAGMLLANSEGHRGDQQVLQVGLPARELLAEMRAFAKREGIASRKSGEHVNPKYAAGAAVSAAASRTDTGRGDGMGGASQPGYGPPGVPPGLMWDAAELELLERFNPKQLRGAHTGQWVKGGATATAPAPAAPAAAGLDAAQTRAIAEAAARVEAAKQAQLLDEKHGRDMDAMLAEMRAVTEDLRKTQVSVAAAKEEETHKAHGRLLTRLGTIAAGLVIGAVEAKFGVPGEVAMASTVSPELAHELLRSGPEVARELIEFRKRL